MYQPITSLDLPHDINDTKKTLNNKLKFVDDLDHIVTAPSNELITARKIPESKSCYELYLKELKEEKVSTTIEELDEKLNGGLRHGQITEFTGESGSGKTQLCMTITVTKLLMNEAEEVLYLCTNNNFSKERAKELIHKLNKNDISKNKDETVRSVLSRIELIEINDVADLVASVKYLDTWLADKKISILILDSIFLPLKEVDYKDRKGIIFRLLSNLQILGRKYRFPIIVTNNITTRIQSDNEVYHPSCLGENYFHRINTRIQISKLENHFEAALLKSVYHKKINTKFHIP